MQSLVTASRTGLVALLVGVIAAASTAAPARGPVGDRTEDPFVASIPASEVARAQVVLSKCEAARMTAEETAHELVALGESAWNAAFTLLALPPEQGQAPEEEGAALQAAPRPQETLLAFGSAIGSRPLLDLVERISRLAVRPELRTAGVRVLAERAEARNLPLLLRCATPSTRNVGAAEPFLDPLAVALTRMFQRDGQAFHALELAWTSQDRRLLDPMIRSLGESGDARALPTLLAMLDGTQEQDELILAQIGRLAPKLSRETARRAAERVRSCIGRGSPETCRGAALALGWLLDTRGLPQLVEILGSEFPQPRDAALWALRRICGLDLGPEPGRWAAWYREEKTWFEEGNEAARQSLLSADESSVAAALQEIAQHPLFVDEFLGPVSKLLDHSSPGIRRLTCEVLFQIGNSDSIPAFVAMLGDQDDTLREGALRALRRITGRDLPADPRIWRTALSGAEWGLP